MIGWIITIIALFILSLVSGVCYALYTSCARLRRHGNFVADREMVAVYSDGERVADLQCRRDADGKIRVDLSVLLGEIRGEI